MTTLKDRGYEIAFVVTCKEAPEYSKTSADFRAYAESNNIPFIYNPKITAGELSGVLKDMEPVDVCVSINYSGIVPQDVIDLFTHGVLNAHGGDLPRYRGNACQAWAIINRETRIGLCIHKMIGGELDSGDIISRDYLSIDENTRIGEVNRWMDKKIPELMHDAIRKLERDPAYVLEKQSQDPKDALRCYPRTPADGRIDWSRNNEDILRLINASSEPYSGAFCFLNDQNLKVWRGSLVDDGEVYLAVPGQVAQIEKDGSMIVITGKGKLRIEEVSAGEEKQRVKPSLLVKSIRQRLT